MFRAGHYSGAARRVGAAGRGAESLSDCLNHPYCVSVVDGDLHVFCMKHARDAGTDLPEADHARRPTMPDVTTAAQQRFGGDHH